MKRIWVMIIAGSCGLLGMATDVSATFLRVASPAVVGDGRSYSPVLYVDSRGVTYLAWVDGRREKFDLYVVRSRDGGRTWSAEVRIDAAKPASLESIALTFAEGQGGGLHAVWQGTYSDHDVRVLHAVSRDRGTTWSPFRSLQGPVGLGYDPQIASDRSGSLHVVWHEQRPSKEPPQQALGFQLTRPQEFEVFFARSEDDGTSWFGPVRVSPRITSPLAFRPQIVYGGRRDVYLAWEEREAGQRHPGIYVAASSDRGKSWPVQGLRISRGALPADTPELAADRSGHVYATWSDLRHGAAAVYFSTSADHGRTWLAQDVRLGHGPLGRTPSLPPRLAVAEAGRVFVSWIDARHSAGLGVEIVNRGDVFFTRSEDFGRTWLDQDIRLNTPPPGSTQVSTPRMVVDAAGSLVAAVWTDNRSGKDAVYLTYSTDGGRTWLRKETHVDHDASADQTGHSPILATTPDGGLVVAWEVGRIGGRVATGPGPVPRDVRARRIEVNRR